MSADTKPRTAAAQIFLFIYCVALQHRSDSIMALAEVSLHSKQAIKPLHAVLTQQNCVCRITGDCRHAAAPLHKLWAHRGPAGTTS